MSKSLPFADELLDAAPSETAPWLLELARRQAARRRPADLVRQWARHPFVAPSAFDQRQLHQLDGIALEAASAFEAVQLSPVAPLGVCSVLAPTSQNRVVSAQRTTEVVADPTNVLALECAARLRRRTDARVRLCTVHQTLRAQSVPDAPGFGQHFRMFALVQAGRGLPDEGFERRAAVEHLTVFDRMFDAAAKLGCRFEQRQAQILAAPGRHILGDRVQADLERALPHVTVRRSELDSTYYAGLRVLFGATSPSSGEFFPIADTGNFDWVAQLAANRKYRFIASGIGIQLFPVVFGADGVPEG